MLQSTEPSIHADALANWETIKVSRTVFGARLLILTPLTLISPSQYFTAENREIARYITAMKA